MRKLMVLFFILFSFTTLRAQSDDAALNSRISEYLRYSRELNFEKLLEYTHPSLFTISPREELLKAMKAAFENEMFTISVDSMKVISLSPVFRHEGVIYRKVDYSMVMRLKFNDSEMIENEEFREIMKTGLAANLPGSDIRYDNGTFHISGNDMLMSIRDDDKSPWLFIGNGNSAELVSMLFPEEVILHFGLGR